MQQALLMLAAGVAVLLQAEATCPSGTDCPAVILNTAVSFVHFAPHLAAWYRRAFDSA